MFLNSYNYLSSENNITIKYISSESKLCSSKNLLNSNNKQLWLSNLSTPQTIILDLRKIKKSSFYKYFGIYCWHAYNTNPKKISLEFSEDNNNYLNVGNFLCELKSGNQFFELKHYNNNIKVNYIKIIIHNTYGGNRTYLNQIFLYDDKEENNFYKTPDNKYIKKDLCDTLIPKNIDFLNESYNESFSIEFNNNNYFNNTKSNINIYNNYTKKFNNNNKEKKIEKKVKKKILSNSMETKSNKKNENNNKFNNIYNIEKIKKSTIKKNNSNLFGLMKAENSEKNFLKKKNNTNNNSIIFDYKKLENDLKNMEEHLNFLKLEEFKHENNFDENDKKIDYINNIDNNNLNHNVNDLEKYFDKINKQLKNLEIKIDLLENEINNKNIKKNQFNDNFIEYILNECSKIIENKFYQFKDELNLIKKMNDNNNLIEINKEQNFNLDENFKIFEKNLNIKIEKKFENLTQNLQTQILNNYLQPTFKNITNNMSRNLKEIKDKINILNSNNKSSLNSIFESRKLNGSLNSNNIFNYSIIQTYKDNNDENTNNIINQNLQNNNVINTNNQIREINYNNIIDKTKLTNIKNNI